MNKYYQLLLLFIVFGILAACEKDNHPPTIRSLTASPLTIKTGDTIQIECIATDPDDDQLGYSWSSSNGQITGGIAVNIILWKVPEKPGTTKITVVVSDGKDITEGSLEIMVEPNPQL